MRPNGTPDRAPGAEDVERARIKALWQALVAGRQGSYLDVHEELQLLVNSTIRAFSEQENALRMINQFPTELFTHVASFLGQRDLWMSTLVCRGWRARLLRSPRLWTRVCISQRSCAARWSRRSLALLGTLLARSQSLPLSIEFRCMDGDDDEYDEDLHDYDNIADIMAAEMHRVRSLSLILPNFSGTTFEGLLGRPAPVLVCCRLYAIRGSEYLCESLFADHAPRLTNLAFSMVDFYPGASYKAVQAVTHFAHDAGVLVTEDVDAIALSLPALQSLMLSADDCEVAHESAGSCTIPLRVCLPNMGSILPIFKAFPNATSFCLSSANQFSKRAVQALFETVGHPTSIDLDYSAYRSVYPEAHYEPDEIVMNIKLNGVDVVVDMGSDETRTALDLLFERLQSVRHMAINEDLWPLFGPRLAIPSVRELTVYLHPPAGEATWRAAGLLVDRADLNRTTAHFPKFKLSLLRLVSPANVLMPGLRESVVADVVRTLADPSALRTLVFCGVDLVLQPPGRLRSLVPHLNIVSEPRPIPPSAQPWFWTFPADDAIHV